MAGYTHRRHSAAGSSKSTSQVGRRAFLSGMLATACVPSALAAAQSAQPEPASRPDRESSQLNIADLELVQLSGHHETEAGVNNQYQVNQLDVFDDYRRPEYHDQDKGKKQVPLREIYLRIRTRQGLDGLYGPIDEEAAIVVRRQLRPFLLGKDALAGETLWDESYRSDRHARSGIYLMAISAVDNAVWDLRARFYGVPVYRLLGGPTRKSVEVYGSCLGFSVEPEAVKARCQEVRSQGFRRQKWFLAYGPGEGEEGMHKNVELVRVLRETLGDDTDLMFDAFNGWDLGYAIEWARRVEQYRPRWIEEPMLSEKIESFSTLRRSISIPVAAGEHFGGRWEVERFLQAEGLSVVQADPEWCGGTSELLKIGVVASAHDIPVIPHGHSIHAALHVIASQSPMTFPMAEYLINKMQSYYHFEKNPPVPVDGHLSLPTGPGYNIELDPAKVEHTQLLTWDS